jgi:hypothetical protein
MTHGEEERCGEVLNVGRAVIRRVADRRPRGVDNEGAARLKAVGPVLAPFGVLPSANPFMDFAGQLPASEKIIVEQKVRQDTSVQRDAFPLALCEHASASAAYRVSSVLAILKRLRDNNSLKSDSVHGQQNLVCFDGLPINQKRKVFPAKNLIERLFFETCPGPMALGRLRSGTHSSRRIENWDGGGDGRGGGSGGGGGGGGSKKPCTFLLKGDDASLRLLCVEAVGNDTVSVELGHNFMFL